MATKLEQTKHKKRQETLAYTVVALIIIFLVAIVFTSIYLFSSSTKVDQSTVTTTPDDNTTQDTADFSVLSAVDSQDVLDFLANNTTGFLYVGRPTCPHCQKFAPILTDVVKDQNLTVYYYDTDAANSDPEQKDQALTAIDTTGVPTFMYIESGTIVERLDDTTSRDALINFLNKYNAQ